MDPKQNCVVFDLPFHLGFGGRGRCNDPVTSDFHVRRILSVHLHVCRCRKNVCCFLSLRRSFGSRIDLVSFEGEGERNRDLSMEIRSNTPTHRYLHHLECNTHANPTDCPIHTPKEQTQRGLWNHESKRNTHVRCESDRQPKKRGRQQHAA